MYSLCSINDLGLCSKRRTVNEKRFGTMQAFQEQAMEHTPIPQTSYDSLGAGNHRSAWGTWFEVAKPWSVMNSTFEVSMQSK